MDVVASLRDISGDLRARGIRHLWVFGSVARGDAADASDIDLLVEFEKPPTFMGFMDLKFALEERLGKRVDLHSRGSCPERFLRRIEPDLKHVS